MISGNLYENLPLSLDPRHLYLELSPKITDCAWESSKQGSTSWSRWNIFLNQLCTETFLDYLHSELKIKARLSPKLGLISSLGELVNGCVVEMDDLRLVIIPSETWDIEQWLISQEWIDIPAWVADYYLPVVIDPEDGWMQIYGFIPHSLVKTQGIYEAQDRQYRVEAEDIRQDLNGLWLRKAFGLTPKTRSEVAALPSLSPQQFSNLIERLSKPELIFPRLEIPFQQWGTLLSHQRWRQQLSDRRQGRQAKILVSQWLQSKVPESARLDWSVLTQPRLPSGARGSEPEEIISLLSRNLVIAGREYELYFIPLDIGTDCWRVELRPGLPGELIPGGLALSLLTENLQPFENNVAVSHKPTHELVIEVILAPGEGLVWETSPLPENYVQEILYF